MPECKGRGSGGHFLPLTWTAEMTLSHLAEAGDADAAALFEGLGLHADDIIDSPSNIVSPEYRLARTVFLNTRCLVTDALAALTKAALFVELPCGLSPRGLRYAREKKPYLGVDLPPVAQRISKVLPPMIDEESRPFVRYKSADATDPDALLSAAGEGEGEICIITEGLLMYFPVDETDRFFEGIRRLLDKRGGCLVTADPEMSLHNFLMLRAICGDSFSEVIRKGFQRKPVRTGRTLPERPKEPGPLQIELSGDIKAQIDRAMSFLSQHGLQAYRMPVSVMLQEPVLPGMLTPAQSEAVNEALENVSCWIITLE